MNCSTDKTFPLKIESQAFGGYGIGRHDGKVFFVADTIQGDEVRVSIREDKKSFAYASVEEVLTPSPLRIDPKCRFEKTCGGCQWLSVPYEKQLSFKESFLIDALQRTGKITLKSAPQIHNGPSIEYRNRVLLRGTLHADGTIHVGFMERASHNQVPIDHCRNIDPLLNNFIKILKQSSANARAQKFRIEVQVLPAVRDPKKPHLLVVLHALHGNEALRPLQKMLSKHPSVAWVGFASDVASAPHVLFEQDLGCDFHTAPAVFQQVNVPLNHQARRLIKTFTDAHAIRSILDLFCGSGNLSLALAGTCSVLGVEQASSAIRVAKTNVKANGLRTAHYVCAPALSFLKERVSERAAFDLMIADPPRAGMKECLPSIKALKPKFIAYMSCDPMTLARDLKELGTDYEILETHLLDFFPNTYHLETLVFLTRQIFTP